jgi:hypothetical protein
VTASRWSREMVPKSDSSTNCHLDRACHDAIMAQRGSDVDARSCRRPSDHPGGPERCANAAVLSLRMRIEACQWARRAGGEYVAQVLARRDPRILDSPRARADRCPPACWRPGGLTDSERGLMP